MKHDTLVVIDFGSENNQIVAGIVRRLGVFCVVYNAENIGEKLSNTSHKAIILTGKSKPDYDIEYSSNVPVLDLLGKNIDENEIKRFVLNDCGLKADWTPENFIQDAITEIKQTIGDKKALLALSGGVDSTVCAVLVNKAIGKNLMCVFVDHGLMRLDEGDEIMRVFKNRFDMDIIRVNAEERFLSKLSGVTDPEQKRKVIGEEFIRVFEEESKKIGDVDFLVQGTIYPDIIESGTKESGVIKSHHNVGGLPDVIDFNGIVEPLKDLFKDEVRKVGHCLGIPSDLVERQPFPGPGLGVRVIGEITKEKLDILRQADYIFRSEIERERLNLEIWQYFAVLTNLRSVGVRNESRTYGYTVALRAIRSVDAMSGQWAKIPYDLLERVSNRITGEIVDVSRVVYDVSNKPPATIEWE